jgi:hypothetical protein
VEITPEKALRWAREDLKEAETAYQSAQSRLDIATEDWMDCREAVTRAEQTYAESPTRQSGPPVR